ncbi:MAG: NifU family protein [Myxococcota bacterium]
MNHELEQLVHDLDRLETIVSDWDAHQQATVTALRTTIEQIQAEAFRRLIRQVKQDPAGLAALVEAVDDPWVFNVLQYHGLLKKPAPSIEDRVEAALDTVRPSLASHDGDVELIAFVPPDEIQIRMLGGCDGCAFTTATVKLGIERAVKDAVPEIRRVTVVKGNASAENTGVSHSPFSTPWEDAGPKFAVPRDAVIAVELERASVLLTRVEGVVKAYPNACTHLGMPLDMGEVSGGVLTCRYHNFQYLLATGECLTAPEVALPSYPVRIRNGRVEVQVTL